MSLNRPLIVALLMAVLLALAWWRMPSEQEQTLRRSQLIMGTLVEITALGDDRSLLESAVTDAFQEMSRIEQLMSPHIDGSDVARLSGPVSELEVSPETRDVVEQGLEIARKSQGAFDLSMGRLIAVWDILDENPQVPEPETIRRAREGLGPEALQLQGTRVKKTVPGLQIDLGSIAKGYAVDRAWEVLQRAGVQHASVNAGGDLRVLGDRRGRPWRIGLQHPRKAGAILAVLPSADEAVVTSGDYERYFEQDGQRYHHLIDPRTGYPANECQAVTVVAPTAALADGLATAVFVLGPTEGDKLLRQWPDVEGLIVTKDGQSLMTPGLEGRLEWP